MALVHVLSGHWTYQLKHVATDTQCAACLNRLLTIHCKACECAAHDGMVHSEHVCCYLRLTELLCSFLESAFDSLSWNNINKRTRSCVCLYQFGKAQDKVRAFTLPNSFGATKSRRRRADVLTSCWEVMPLSSGWENTSLHYFGFIDESETETSFLEGKWGNIFWVTVRAVSLYFPA